MDTRQPDTRSPGRVGFLKGVYPLPKPHGSNVSSIVGGPNGAGSTT